MPENCVIGSDGQVAHHVKNMAAADRISSHHRDHRFRASSNLTLKIQHIQAIHTLDIMHVIERLWGAGMCLYHAGSKELEQWVEQQKDLLYGGRVTEIIRELRHRRRKLCRSKKNENRRERLKDHIDYLAKRVPMMNYAELVDEDLELGSGAVEGAVKHIIGKRCDQGGMRWIVERNEAVVQLRCIEVNGHWGRFIEFVHEKVRLQQLDTVTPVRVQQKEAETLPDILEPPGWRGAA